MSSIKVSLGAGAFIRRKKMKFTNMGSMFDWVLLTNTGGAQAHGKVFSPLE
jgi:hypothetical protein